MSSKIASRRDIFRVGLASLVGSGISKASAQNAGSAAHDRVVVCVYLMGGNDANNMLVPLDQYGHYAASRGPLAIPAAQLLNVQNDHSGSAVGFHPAMTKVHSLFTNGKLAVSANVGSERFELSRHSAPNLAYFPQGYVTARWAAQAANSEVITGFRSQDRGCSLSFSGLGAARRRAEILARSPLDEQSFRVSFPATTLGRQLSHAAFLLQSGVTTGIRQRTFFAIQAGYDTHTNQLARQAALLADLSYALAAFHAATEEMGIADNVTTYTDSDFGRTLKPNKRGGSDHGWGSHQFVMGGALPGGRVYGTFPELRLRSSHDATGTGVWRPEITKEQHAAAVASWAGAPRVDNSFFSLS